MKIDVNCDVGEGVKNEHLLMPYISSCSIACGGHFGNARTIDRTMQLAIDHNVKMGAHPSFPDTENFGRKRLQISDDELQKSIRNQLDLFEERLLIHQGKWNHIKPHGALYNTIAADEKLATLFVEIIKKYRNAVFLYVPYKSVIEDVAIRNDVPIKHEAFADRNYNNDYSLVSRQFNNAVITDEKKVLNHILSIIEKKEVKTITGDFLKIKGDTLCVHGDTKSAHQILKYLSKELPKKDIFIDK